MEPIAIVTGANGGIGSAIAIGMARNGYKVVLHYHKRYERVLEIEKELKPENCLLVSADVNIPTEVNNLIKKTIEKFGRIDVLVNNVGINMDRTLLKMSRDEWDQVIGTNLTGIYNVTKPVAEVMVKQGVGVIIKLSSIVGESGNYGQTNYSSSKAGVIAFTKSLALELVSKGIRVNAIAPGFVDTDMTRKIPENIKAKIIEQIPMKRFGTPDEIAHAVIYLCKATYVTGAVLDVNGGLK